MTHFETSGAHLSVTLTESLDKSMNRPLAGIATLTADSIVFTQTPRDTQPRCRNPRVFDGKTLSVTVNADGVVRINNRCRLTDICARQQDLVEDFARALVALMNL